MIKYYCKKCNLDNDGPMCMNCGKKLSGSTMHSVWAIRRLPLTDGGVWLGALGIASLVVLILFLLIFGAEGFLIPAMIIIAAVLLLTKNRSVRKVEVIIKMSVYV